MRTQVMTVVGPVIEIGLLTGIVWGTLFALLY